ncbi:extracellular solute-binding protein [Algibacillus agarilyticus]|uniref:extracellular solute-binding protein n=1 Tax=Algibacillus agarilyticus TaxID=2234133 RepID=UPI000DD0C46B|nr:extracellular solute-binding protein [Algibacillus agarilyticus]
MKSIFNSILLITTLALSQLSWATTEQSLNIYSYRQPFLIEPILDKFTQQTGIKTNIVFAKKGLIERLEREDKYTKADIVLTSNFATLLQLKDRALTRLIDSEAVRQNIPHIYRDPDEHWIALTKRVRSIYTAKTLMSNHTIRYEDLADAKYKGKVCTISGKHSYNLGLIASMIAHSGSKKTKDWLSGVKQNLARRPQGNERAQVKAIKEGLCDISLGNSYYYGMMMKDQHQKAWAQAVNINFPNQADRGAHINVSGIAITRYAPNSESALKLVEYLTTSEAQELYATWNMEYPVKTGVPLSPLVASWGEFKSETLPLTTIAKYQKQALKLVDEIKFDL